MICDDLIRIVVIFLLSGFKCFASLNIFHECNPNATVENGKFRICAFKSNFDVDLNNVSDVYRSYTNVRSPEIAILFCFVKFDFSCQGSVQYVGQATLSSIKVKRNQFPYIIPGLPNHQFGYVVFGNLNIVDNQTKYTLCSRSDDG